MNIEAVLLRKYHPIFSSIFIVIPFPISNLIRPSCLINCYVCPPAVKSITTVWHLLRMQTLYSAIHCMIVVLKDTASYRVAKGIAPSLSLFKGLSLKIRKRTTFTQRFGKLFTPVLSLPAGIGCNR